MSVRARVASGRFVGIVVVVTLATGAAACSLLLDTDRLDRNHCESASDCAAVEACDPATHICSSAEPLVDASADAGDVAADGSLPEGGGPGLPTSDWQYQLYGTTAPALSGVAFDGYGNVLMLGTSASEVDGINSDFGGGAAQMITSARYPDTFVSGISGDGQNLVFNFRVMPEDAGARPGTALFAGDFGDAGDDLLVVFGAPAPSLVTLDGFDYNVTGSVGGLTAGAVHLRIVAEASDAGTSTVSLPVGLRAPGGALYLAGYFTGLVTVGKTTYASVLNALGVPSNDGLLVRLDPAGGDPEAWVFATAGDDQISGLCDVAGNLGIAGVFSAAAAGTALDFQGSPVSGVISAGKGDGFLAVMSDPAADAGAPGGQLLVARAVGGSGVDALRAITYLPRSNELVVGGRAQKPITIGAEDFDAGTMTEFNLLAAFDATSGAALWADLFDYGSADSLITRVTSAPSGGDFFVGGQFSGDLVVGSVLLEAQTRSGFVAHLTADGGTTWAAALGDGIHDLLVDTDGGLLVSGTFSQPLVLAGDASFSPDNGAAGAIFLAHFPAP